MAFPSPALAAPALLPYQISYRGLVFGGIAPLTAYELMNLTVDMPDVASGDVQRALDQGEFKGVDVLPGADITIVQAVTAVAAPVQQGPFQLPTVTNLIPNPSGEYDTVGNAPAWWVIGSAGDTSITIDNAWAAVGSNSFHVIGNGSAGSPGMEAPTGTSGMPIQANQTYTFTMPVQVNAISGTVTHGLTARILWYTSAGGAAISQNDGTALTVTGPGVFTPTVTATAPSNAAFASVRWYITFSTSNTFDAYADAAILAPPGTAYFDGDSPGCRWNGTPGNSTSTNLPALGTQTATTIDQAAQALGGVMGPTGIVEYPLWYQLPGGIFCRMCRPRKHNCPTDINRVFAGVAQATSLLHSSDPRWYAAPSQSQTVSLPASIGGGLAIPPAVPWALGAGSAGGLLNVVNSGPFESRPVLIITGPCTNPVIANTSIAGAPQIGVNLTLNAGDTVVIDMDWRSIVYTTAGSTAGAPARYALMNGSTWWNLPAESTNTIEFTSADTSPVAGTLTIQSASAYLSL